MPEEARSYVPLLIVFFLAFGVPIALSRFRRLRLPVVVGEIAAGAIVGPNLLGWVWPSPLLEILGDIGLAFLMFLAGIEIDFGALFPANGRRNGPASPLGRIAVVYLLTLALAIPGGHWLSRIGVEGDPWLLAFILSATSLGVLMPLLKERGLSRTPIGQAAFLSAMLADVVTVVLLTVFLIFQAYGLSPQILAVGLLFVAFLIAYRLAARITGLTAVRAVVEELSQATVQLKVRGAIAILLSFVVLAELAEAELILGAFLAGMVISLIKTRQDDALVEKLEAFGFGFFIPVFFILVGVTLDLRTLASTPKSLLLLPILFGVALAVKAVPSVVALSSSLGLRQALAVGLLLNTHLSLEVAVAVIGVRTGMLTPATGAAVTVFAVLSVVVMPLVFGALAPAAAKARARWFVICGAGHQGLNVARELQAHGDQVRLLDDDQGVVEEARRSGFTADFADGLQALEALDPAEIRAFLALCSEDDRALVMGKTALARGVDHAVARLDDPTRAAEFRQAGVKPFVPGISQATMLALMARNPDVFDLLTSATDERDVREVFVQNRSLAGRQLRDLALPGGLRVLTIHRGGETIVPHGDDTLELDDRLTFLGSLPELDEVTDLVES
jgi:Kef-type K+ transport system membrane component KefB/Trk K+ transport system NAD-binding subunit